VTFAAFRKGKRPITLHPVNEETGTTKENNKRSNAGRRESKNHVYEKPKKRDKAEILRQKEERQAKLVREKEEALQQQLWRESVRPKIKFLFLAELVEQIGDPDAFTDYPDNNISILGIYLCVLLLR
jgi:hypothetical protein